MCRNYKIVLCHLCLVPLLWAGSSPIRKMAWNTPVPVRQVKLLPDPSLPTPILDHEPPFTRGADNTVSWADSMQAVYDSLDALDLSIQYFEAEAMLAAGDTIWGYVDANARSATFFNLPNSIPIYYRVRYYAMDRQGDMILSLWSRFEVSVQDTAAPVIQVFEIENIQYQGEMSWVVESQVRLHIRAEDPNGQIMQIGIREKSDLINSEVFDDLDHRPRTVLDTTLQYPILTDMKTPLTLSCWAVDVAEFQSDTLSLEFYWLPSESEAVCFPNPFNPELDRKLVIKVEEPDIEIARIFDPFGNHVKTLRKNPDTELSFEWDGRNEQNDLVAKGGYLCVINGDQRLYCKIAVIR